MNNTFNYSFLVDTDYKELSQQKSHIPSEVINDKYTENHHPKIKKRSPNKAENKKAN